MKPKKTRKPKWPLNKDAKSLYIWEFAYYLNTKDRAKLLKWFIEMHVYLFEKEHGKIY